MGARVYRGTGMARKQVAVVERAGFGPFNLARGAQVDSLVTDWTAAVEALDGEDWISLDLETSGLSWINDYIAVIGLYGPKTRVAAVIHTPDGDIPDGLIHWMSQPGRKFVTHNGATFDILFLYRAGMQVFSAEWFDTLISEQVVTLTNRQGVPKNLQAVVKRRLDVDISKAVDHRDWLAPSLSQQQVRYVAEDISFLPAIREAQLEKASQVDAERGPNRYGNTLTNAIEIEHRLLPTVVRMQVNGLPLDEAALEQYYRDQVKLAAQAKMKLDEIFGDTNWGSWQQIKGAFSRVYDIELLSTQEDALKEVRDLMTGTEIAESITNLLIYKHASKRAGIYNGTFLLKYCRDGRVFARFSQCGTDTGRFSSSQPNLQQIPKSKGLEHGDGARHIFGNDPDLSIVSVDYSQIEFRVAVDLAGDQAAIDLLQDGHWDMHTLVASQVFSVPPDQVTRDQRQLSKAMSFTLLFGGGPGLLSHYAKSQGANLPLERARPLVQEFFERFQGLNRMRTWAYAIADKRRPYTVLLPTGLRRTLVPSQDLRATLILNNLVQGTAAAGLKFALLEAQREGLDQYIGAVVHDEIVAAVPRHEAAEYSERLQAAMLRGMQMVCDQAPVAVAATLGDTWG